MSQMQSDLFFCDGMLLEPRLQEYIKEKQYYKQNKNMIPDVSPEKKYDITKEDVRRIKALLKGRKDIYSHKTQDQFTDYVEMKGFEMDPDEIYKNDPRFERYLTRVGRDKDAMKQRYNYGGLDDRGHENLLDEEYYNSVDGEYDKFNTYDKNKNNKNQNEKLCNNTYEKNYDEDHEENIFENNDKYNYSYANLENIANVNQRNNKKSNTRSQKYANKNSENDDLPEFLEEYGDENDHPSYGRPELDSKLSRDYDTDNKYKYSNPFPTRSQRIYDNYPPTVQNNVRIHPMKNNRPQKEPTLHDPRVGAVIGELETYATKINKSYQFKSDMDDESKMVIPKMRTEGKKYLNTSSYKPMPYLGKGDGMRNVSIETEMQQGMSGRVRKYSENKAINQLYLEQNSGLPCRGAKSLGYENPIEHYFDYVSDDIQDPDHTVMDRGLPTRLDNHAVARQKKTKRDYM